MIRAAWLLLAAITVLSGCVPYTEFADQAVQEQDALQAPTALRHRTGDAVDRMLREAPVLVQAGSPAVVGSVSDIRNMNQATPLGNVIADLVRNRLVERGVPVTDLRLRRAVAFEPGQGEMTLSRNVGEIYPPPAAAEIVTGTYAVASNTVFVSLKIIESDNARILAAGDFALPRTANVNRLLATGLARAN